MLLCWTCFGPNTPAVPRTPPTVIGEVALMVRLVAAPFAVTDPSRSEHAAAVPAAPDWVDVLACADWPAAAPSASASTPAEARLAVFRNIWIVLP
ncbi:hypothetical protein GCM10010522_55800 [Kribbella solani]